MLGGEQHDAPASSSITSLGMTPPRHHPLDDRMPAASSCRAKSLVTSGRT